jgi:hypothetical protein
MADIFKKSADQSVVTAKDTADEPIVIRKLDRLETTCQSSQNGG